MGSARPTCARHATYERILLLISAPICGGNCSGAQLRSNRTTTSGNGIDVVGDDDGIKINRILYFQKSNVKTCFLLFIVRSHKAVASRSGTLAIHMGGGGHPVKG